MHLIESLAAGVSGAENGHVELYNRGSSTRAPWYLSFEAVAGSLDATGDNIDLDSNGGAVVYVDRLVDVIVKNTLGTTIRDFVAGVREDNVEVQSPSFTGTHYETGLNAANNPTTLAAVLDGVLPSFGSVDWNVLVAGETISIQDAVAGSALFVNVKAPRFGAQGDGVTDDTAQIQAALDYGFSVGIATVYFPPGTYLISDVLSVPPGVNLLGNGILGFPSEIKRSTSNNPFVAQDSLIPSNTLVSGLRFLDADSGTNDPYINVTDGSTLIMEFCEFVPPTNVATAGAPCFNADAGNIILRSCTITLRGAGYIAFRVGAGPLANETVMYGCYVNVAGNLNYSTSLLNGIFRLWGNTFHTSFTTGLTAPAAFLRPYTPSTIYGNKFTSAISDALVAILVDGSAGAGTANGIVEAGNLYGSTYNFSSSSAANMLVNSLLLRRTALTIAAPGTLSITALGGQVAVTTTGGAGAYVMSFSTGVPMQSAIDIVIRNTTANAHTIETLNTSPIEPGGAGVALPANQIARTRYVFMTVGATTTWWRTAGWTVTVV